MKSQKGVTMMGLVIYVISFLLVTVLVGSITTFFYSNIDILDTSIGSNSQYNKFNLYLLKECKKQNNELFAWSGNISRLSETPEEERTFITFKNTADETKNSFIYDEDNQNLYYNSIKLCDKVEDFQVKVDEATGKTVLNVFIKIDGTTFTTEYVVNP